MEPFEQHRSLGRIDREEPDTVIVENDIPGDTPLGDPNPTRGNPRVHFRPIDLNDSDPCALGPGPTVQGGGGISFWLTPKLHRFDVAESIDIQCPGIGEERDRPQIVNHQSFAIVVLTNESCG